MVTENMMVSLVRAVCVDGLVKGGLRSLIPAFVSDYPDVAFGHLLCSQILHK